MTFLERGWVNDVLKKRWVNDIFRKEVGVALMNKFI